MELTSPAFKAGERLPDKYCLDCENLSPPFAWSGVPAATKSLVLLCNDPDAPRGTWRHWALFDLPPDLAALPAGYSGSVASEAVREGVNDFKRSGYDGPAPPPGHGTHHYHFRLFALDIDGLSLPAEASCAEVEAAAARHVLASAELVGTYSR